MIEYRHASGDDVDGCLACGEADQEETGGELWPYCRAPEPDDEGVCAFCGHAVEVAG